MDDGGGITLDDLLALGNVATTGVGDPWSDWSSWDTYTINGIPCPGIIERDGIRGLDRVTEWDRKSGKGQRGATLTISQQPLAVGTITSLIWTPTQYYALQTFIGVLTYYSNKANTTNAATIGHPSLSILNIVNVVVGRMSPLRHLGFKIYRFTAEFIEWAPPPDTSVVSTPITADAVQASEVPGDLPPAVRQAQAQNAQASMAHASAASENRRLQEGN